MTDDESNIPGTERREIVLVDDEPSILSAIERVLSRDFTVSAFTSPDEALARIGSRPNEVAVVLADQTMPEMTGLELLERVRDVSPDTVRALLSGQLDLESLSEAVNRQLVHRIFLKPWDNEYLKLQILEARSNHAMLTEKRRLEGLSITDPLTLLKNHRYFQDQLRIEVERGDRHYRAMSLLMVDIDHFKAFNDQFGHPAGDRLLRAVSQRLLDQVRTLDTVARYGGEEFGVILPDTAFDQAMLVAERVRMAFEKTPFAGPDGRPVFLTLSIGIATSPAHAKSADHLIVVADSALYRAKRQGRNQSVGGDVARR